MKWNHEKFIDAVINHRYTFVCTPFEFFRRFGDLSKATKNQQLEVEKLAVYCKDRMIRPR